MTQKQYANWLTDPQLTLQALIKDIHNGSPFEKEELLEAFKEEPSFSVNDIDVATWAYNANNKELFELAISCDYLLFPSFIIPVYETTTTLWTGQQEHMALYLTRMKDLVVTIIHADIEFAGEEMAFHDVSSFDIDKVIDAFIDTAEENAAYISGCRLTIENSDELEAEGRLGGSVTYMSYLDWKKVKDTHYIVL